MYNARASLNKYIQDTIAPLVETDGGYPSNCLQVLFERNTHHKFPQLRVSYLAEGLWEQSRLQHYSIVQFEISDRENKTAITTKMLQSFYKHTGLLDDKAPHQRFYIDRLDYANSLTSPIKIDKIELYMPSQDGWVFVNDTDESVRRFIMTMNMYYYLK